jgi:glutaredoxin-dependent peroxiredoxin
MNNMSKQSGKVMIGDTAPDFELPDTEMKIHKLSNYRGKNIILAFYPAAESPVCTVEMCAFRDSLSELQNINTTVIGVSVDGPFANKIFATNRKLTFPLLSDYKRDVISSYGITMKDLGPLKDYNAAKRSIYIIDKNGKVNYVWISENPLVEPIYSEIKESLKKIS